MSYDTLNDVAGVMDSLSHEFKRRFQDPYEDLKREENGEVFDWLSGRIDQMNTEREGNGASRGDTALVNVPPTRWRDA